MDKVMLPQGEFFVEDYRKKSTFVERIFSTKNPLAILSQGDVIKETFFITW
jgi:hypothetical protein